MATRDAAAAPGGMDSMAFFEGSYALQPLSSKTPMKPLEVLISTTNGGLLLPYRVLPLLYVFSLLSASALPQWSAAIAASLCTDVINEGCTAYIYG